MRMTKEASANKQWLNDFVYQLSLSKNSSGSAVSWAILDRSIGTVAASPRLPKVTVNA